MIRIEKVLPSDFYEIANVWEASVRATHHFLSETDIVILRNAILKMYLPDEENLYCVRNANREIVAFIGISNENIDMLFIHPSERGKGLGKKLIYFAINKFQIKTVDVNEQNEQAVKFYKKVGFKVVSRDEVDSAGKPYPLLHMQLRKSLLIYLKAWGCRHELQLV